MSVLNYRLLKLIPLSILFLISCSGGDGGGENSAGSVNFCPENFIEVPSLIDYTTENFCVSKYEMKNDGADNALSRASGTPYVDVTRNEAITKCQQLGSGYDLITNDEWQTIARNIERVALNWELAQIGSVGGLSRGHSDDSPSNTLAASSDDDQGCFETGQTCDSRTWNAQKRNHIISNSSVIWDFSGNVWEWVKDNNGSNYGANAYISQVTPTSHNNLFSLSGGTTTTLRTAKSQFGPIRDHADLNSGNRGGLGFGILNSGAGAVARGGDWSDGVNAGAFAVILNRPISNRYNDVGFRCVFRPSEFLPPPVVTSVNPSSGSISGGTEINISGSTFLTNATVMLGTSACTSVVVNNENSITCMTPSSATFGFVDITVTNSDGQFDILAQGFGYLSSPTITSVSPSSGSTNGGTEITILGSDFFTGATITVGGTSCPVSIITSGSLTCTTGARTSGGLVDIVVENSDGQTATASDAFTYLSPPSITSVNPSSGSTAGGTNITISGTNFSTGATVMIGGVACPTSIITSKK